MSGVKDKLELRQGKEIIVKAVVLKEEAAIGENEASLAPASTSLKRTKRQKPLKTSKRSRKQSVASNATSKK